MDDAQGGHGRATAESSTSTTATSGPHTTTTTTTTTSGQGTTVRHFGPDSTTVTSPTITTTTRPTSTQPSISELYAQEPSTPQRARSSSIRIRRPAPQQSAHDAQRASVPEPSQNVDASWQAGRRRSNSEPRPPPQAMFGDDGLRREATASHPHMQPLYEGITTEGRSTPSQGPSHTRRGLTRQSSAFAMRRNSRTPNQNMMGNNVVDVLDVIGQ